MPDNTVKDLGLHFLLCHPRVVAFVPRLMLVRWPRKELCASHLHSATPRAWRRTSPSMCLLLKHGGLVLQKPCRKLPVYLVGQDWVTITYLNQFLREGWELHDWVGQIKTQLLRLERT